MPDQRTPLEELLTATSELARVAARVALAAERLAVERSTPAAAPAASHSDIPLTMRLPEAARLLGIGESSARDLVAAGKLQVVKVGTRVIVPRNAVLEFLSTHRQ